VVDEVNVTVKFDGEADAVSETVVVAVEMFAGWVKLMVWLFRAPALTRYVTWTGDAGA
jgi:hypothetical protein